MNAQKGIKMEDLGMIFKLLFAIAWILGVYFIIKEFFQWLGGIFGIKPKKAEAEVAAKALASLTDGMQKTDSGLYYQITKEGNGVHPEKGTKVSVHYKGTLTDGTVFDSSYQRNEPIEFSVGVGQVIPGWDEGILLLSKGAAARLVIPSELAYGSQGAGGVIPPDATLVFEVELVDC